MKENERETESTEEQSPPEKKGAGRKVRKIFSIVFDVILYLFLALSLLVLVLSLTSKNNPDGAIGLFNHEMRIVVSSSMEKSEYSPDVSNYKIKDIKVKSMIFVERVPEDEAKAKKWYDSLQVGDVLTFRYVVSSSQVTITHRLIEKTPTENGYVLRLQGDNRASDETSVGIQTIYTSSADYPSANEHFNYVIGKVTGQSVVLGHIVYAVKQPVGIALIVIVPSSIILIWQVVRIIAVVGEDRKKKAAAQVEEAQRKAAAESAERERQAQELEELKRKFAELEKQKAESGSGENGDGSSDG